MGTLAFVALIDIENISLSSMVSEALNRHIGLEFISKGSVLMGNLLQGAEYFEIQIRQSGEDMGSNPAGPVKFYVFYFILYRNQISNCMRQFS